MSMLRTVAVNVAGEVESATASGSPFAVDRGGTSYLPVGDGGLVLGVDLGDGVWWHAADHVAPGVCLVHADQAARHSLTALSCIGNVVTVRSGAAAGERGVVIGKRGEAGRVIVHFEPEVRRRLRPGDGLSVRAMGQGSGLDDVPLVTLMNADPALWARLPITSSGGVVGVEVRAIVPSKAIGNGIGRPCVQWDLDLQLDQEAAHEFGAGGLRLGDLVAIEHLDTRWNAGFRKDWLTVGAVCHGGSPLPGHGPGITPILTGPPGTIEVSVNSDDHAGLTAQLIGKMRDGR